MAAQPYAVLTILRRKQVEARTGLSRSTLYDLIKAGKFPPPIPLGCKSVGWVESEVNAWLAEQIKAARKSAKPGAADHEA